MCAMACSPLRVVERERLSSGLRKENLVQLLMFAYLRMYVQYRRLIPTKDRLLANETRFSRIIVQFR